MAEQQPQPQPHTPHVVILPLPAQGHVKPMFNLAQLLCLHDPNLKVTFVNSIHNHDRLLNSISDLSAFHDRFPGLRFESLPDGLSSIDRSRVSSASDLSGLSRIVLDVFLATVSVTKPLFRELMIELIGRRREAPPTCVIADGLMSIAIDVAEEVGVPIITFRTYSATCTWVYFHIQKLIQDGQIPFPENEDMDKPINEIPEFENILRRRDLPSICRIQEVENPMLQFYLTQTSAMTRASALILNTFHELEAPAVSRLASLFPKVYTIGPLHAFLNTQVNASSSPSDSSDGSLWQQDRTCMTWLDNQPSKSVVYVSFGSVVTLTRDQLLEFWYGVVKSGKPFLWVIRKNLITDGDSVGQIPVEIQEATEERGCIVDWAPQEEVLAHRAIGGFLTHNGWNSTLESIYAGVPMIGWPQIADQQVNSRCVSELWRIGADMKDTCDRFTVEKMVRELMEGDHREMIVKSMDEIAKLARDSVKQGGSSYRNLEMMINDIRLMCLK